MASSVIPQEIDRSHSQMKILYYSVSRIKSCKSYFRIYFFFDLYGEFANKDFLSVW